MDVWNRHRESEIHDIHEIGSGTKLYYLWVKGYSIWGERDTIFLCWLLLHLPQTTCGTQSANYWSGFSWPRKSTVRTQELNPLVRRLELNSPLFLKSPKSSAYASGAWCHSYPLILFSIWGFILTSVNDASSPRVSEHLRACLHLTNPCAEPKGSQPN